MRKLARTVIAPALALLLTASMAEAQVVAGSTSSSNNVPVPKGAERVATAVRTTSSPVLDGKLDDAAWRAAQVIDGFLEYEPNTGAVPRFKTEVRVLYDDRYMYVMARMFDPAPDSIISLLSRRDVRTESEQLKLVIDSYHDRRTAYQFIVNPAGVKRDFYVYTDNNEDVTWDGVWEGSARVRKIGRAHV